jgi:hypothetical protein
MMGQPSWREIRRLQVPDRPAALWTPALDYVTPAKLYRITVEPQAPPPAPAPQAGAQQAAAQQGGPQQPAPAQAPAPQDQAWTPAGEQACTADGNPALSRNGGLVIDGCAPGALIGKIGGSTADLKPDKDKVILFSVGRHCVFSVTEAAKTGALYLGINDGREGLTGVQGQLEVTICEAL